VVRVDHTEHAFPRTGDLPFRKSEDIVAIFIMVSLLHILSYAGGAAGFIFVTLSLASGLLWIAELIEEHSRTAKVVGMRAIYVIIGLQVLLLIVDQLPPLLILFSILCHLVYLQNFTASWPFISLTSARFLTSCCLVVADHFLWFFYFAEKAQSAKRYNRAPKYRYGQKKDPAEIVPTFMDVAAFFAICVWLVPLFLFLSLSANDNALPSFGGDPSMVGTPSGEPRTNPIDLSASPTVASTQYKAYPGTTAARRSLLKSILAPVLSLLPRIRRRTRQEEGLIAPRTPVRGNTPVQSPSLSHASYTPWGGPDDTPGGATPAFTERVNSSFGLGGKGTMLLTPPPPRRVNSDINIASPSKTATTPRTSTESPRSITGNAVASSINTSASVGGTSLRRATSANPELDSGKARADY